jgi:hypothetical protein
MENLQSSDEEMPDRKKTIGISQSLKEGPSL